MTKYALQSYIKIKISRALGLVRIDNRGLNLKGPGEEVLYACVITYLGKK